MGRTQVNVKVSENQKQEWEDAVTDHPEVTSLSHLVRLAVTREIRGEHSDSGQESSDVGSTALVSDVEKSLNSIERWMESVEEDLESLRAELKEDDDVWEVISDIKKRLPAKEPGTELTDDDSRVTLSDLVLHVGAAPDTVMDALWELEGSELVWKTEDPDLGEDVYFYGQDMHPADR